ncbi:MAG: hypothetical protein IJX25_01815 [Clostridia bacterium]|nr:hypothetical protein [Clostridia bacterium]
MQNIQTMKKRLTIVICILGVIIVALAGTLIGVLAASSQTIGSNFSISYNIGENIAAKIRLSENYNGTSGYLIVDQNTGETLTDSQGYATFDTATDSSVQPGFVQSDFSEYLSPEDPSHTIYFEVENISGSKPLRVDLSASVSGVSLEVAVKGGAHMNDDSSSADSEGFCPFLNSTYYAKVDTSSSCIIRLTITVDNVNEQKDAYAGLSMSYAVSLSEWSN